MSLTNAQYNSIMKDYEQTRDRNRHLTEQRRREVYTKLPEFKSLDDSISILSVQYGKQAPTIEHFNLSMKKGEIISVVGESGSGKTTVIRAVLGALPGAGRVALSLIHI